MSLPSTARWFATQSLNMASAGRGMIGRTISHYQILETLGEGGMGVVYMARDIHLDRFVAVKILRPEKVADPERKRRFVQEAKAASALSHPNIIHVYDIGQTDGIDYIAMEYVPGKAFDELIPRKGMRLSLALKYAVQVADALARAHGAGIIHRDPKPSNVLLSLDGQPMVLDFNLASDVRNQKSRLGGTLPYMPPEQIPIGLARYWEGMVASYLYVVAPRQRNPILRGAYVAEIYP